MMAKRQHKLLLLLTCFAVSGCGGAAPPTIEALTPYGDLSDDSALASAAELSELRELLQNGSLDSETMAFLQAELDAASGASSRAAETYVRLLSEHPNTVQGAAAALRLTGINTTDAFDAIVREAIDDLQSVAVNPLTAVYLSELAGSLAYTEYIHTDAAEHPEPFEAVSAGLPDEWLHVGPLSPYPRLDLQSGLAPDHDHVLADSYTHNGIVRQTRLLRPDGPFEVPVLGGRGVHIFETWVHLDGARDQLLVLETTYGAVVEVNGRVILDRIEHGSYEPAVRLLPVAMAAGWHRIRLRIGSTGGQPGFRLALVPMVGAATTVDFSARPPEGVLMSEVVFPQRPTSLTQLLPPGIQTPVDAVSAYFLLLFATDTANSVAGELALASLNSLDQRSALVDLASANYVSVDPTRSPWERQSGALANTRAALQSAPDAGGAALSLAMMMAGDGRYESALELLESYSAQLLNEPIYHYTLSILYTQLLLDEQAEGALFETIRLAPEACSAMDDLVGLMVLREVYPSMEELSFSYDRCEQGLRYQALNLLFPSGNTDAALSHLQVLEARHPNDIQIRRRTIDILLNARRFDEARRAIDAAYGVGLDRISHSLYLIDIMLAEGRQADAESMLAATQASDLVGASRSVTSLRAFLESQPVLSDLRIDPIVAVADYEATNLDTDAPVVYALDYVANRYFEDGSGFSLTHQILHVLSREALGTYGEVSVPEGAIVLRARTIKSDGSILEPTGYLGKESISVPNLEVGDYVDIEYWEQIPSPPTGNRTVGSRFYFQIYDAPLSRSELVVEVPLGWTEVVFDSRAGLAEPEITEGETHRRYRFTVDGSFPVYEEPMRPSLDELLPSVRMAHEYSWLDLTREYADYALSTVRESGEMRAIVDGLLEGADDDYEQARLIYRWVMDEIVDTGGFFSAEAAWTLRAGEGERMPLLMQLLRVAGFSPELVFARSWADDQTDTPIPDASTYPYTLIRLVIDGQDVWLDTGQPYAPFGFVDPSMQGTEALAIGQRGEVRRLTTPVFSPELNRQLVSAVISIDSSGDLTGSISEQVATGSQGAIREILFQLPDLRPLIQQLESNLSQSFPGVVVSDFEVSNLESPDEPLTLSYRIVAPGYATVSGDEIHISRRFFDRALIYQIGSEPSRRYPLVVSSPMLEQVDIEIQMPAGFVITGHPSPLEILTPWITYSWSVLEGGIGSETLTLRRETTLAVTRVQPDEYPELTEALRQIDGAEELRFSADRPQTN